MSGEPSAYVFASSGRSSNSVAGEAAYDGDPSTIWMTNTRAQPQSAYIWFDLGGVRPISTIQWLLGNDGFAAGMHIQVSDDRHAWTTLASPGNAPPSEWQALDVNSSARYVRFFFENPDGAPELGGLAEVAVYS